MSNDPGLLFRDKVMSKNAESSYLPSATTSKEGEKDDERAEDDEDDGGWGVEVYRDTLAHHRRALLDKVGHAASVNQAVDGESQHH